ncbi:MAG: hypothetical protein WBX25_22655 [Rhodomicrobium sp.]
MLQSVPIACFLVNAQSYVHFVNKAGSATIERLAKVDPESKEGYYLDLSAFYIQMGKTLKAQRSFADALTAYRKGVDIFARIVKSDPENVLAQRQSRNFLSCGAQRRPEQRRGDWPVWQRPH